MKSHDLRARLQRPTFLNLRVTSRGFEHGSSTAYEVEGYVTKALVIRKLFENRRLACSSEDGLFGRDGTRCQTCTRYRCQPMIRISLRQSARILVIELATTSAENYLRLVEQAEAENTDISAWPLRLTVADHGHWGEVIFERLEGQPTDSHI